MKLIIALLLTFQITKGAGRMDAPFISDIFGSLPTNFDPALIRSAQDYVLLQQVLRMPIQLSKTAQIEGDLLKSWTIEDNYSKYILNLKEGLRWSDNSPISAIDLYNSIQRQIRLKSAIHFNFSSIKKIEVKETHTLIVHLKDSNTRFLKQLAYPEFGLVKSHKKDLLLCDDLKIASGPYKCESFIPNESITLSKNDFYGVNEYSPPKIEIKSSPLEKQLNGLASGRVNFMIPSGSLSQDQFKEIEKNPDLKVYDPHIGFSFWISINPQSAQLQSKGARRYIQSVLGKMRIDFSKQTPFWQPARQLYLPGGFGRPSDQAVEIFWKKISNEPKHKIEKLKFLVSSKFIFKDDIIKVFKENKIALEVVFYSDINDFTNKQKNTNFDLIQINNDFSSIDVSENLIITFNRNRPLVFLGRDVEKYEKILSEIVSSGDSDFIYSKTQEIALSLLEDGYIFPVAYYMTYFYLNKKIDVSNWSQLFPDIKFWKISTK